MKRFPIILLWIGPYIVTVVCMRFDNPFPPIWLALFGLVLLPNMIYACVLPKLGFPGKKLIFWGMFIKLWNIPIYGVILIGLFLDPLLPFWPLFNYSLLLPTTLYGVNGILIFRKKGLFTQAQAAINIFLQFLLFADVFSAVYCYAKSWNQNG